MAGMTGQCLNFDSYHDVRRSSPFDVLCDPAVFYVVYQPGLLSLSAILCAVFEEGHCVWMLSIGSLPQFSVNMWKRFDTSFNFVEEALSCYSQAGRLNATGDAKRKTGTGASGERSSVILGIIESGRRESC